MKRENLQTHRRQFESLKMNDEKDITVYFLCVGEIFNTLKKLGENFKELVIVQKNLRSLLLIFYAKV